MFKSILFNTDMVQAILEDRKTVTRRVIKPHNPVKAAGEQYRQGFGLWIDPTTDNADNDGHIKDYSISPCWSTFKWYVDKYAPYHIGDILYVRETWAEMCTLVPKLGEYDQSILYKATYKPNSDYDVPKIKWKPSINMPKEAARIFLRVTNVSVAKLQDITEEQAKAEGVRKIYDDMTDEEYKDFMRRTSSENPNKKKEDWEYDNYLWHGYGHIPNYKIEKWDYQYSAYESARDSFSSLWQLTIKREDEARYSWSANPWVWVIEFERIEKPETWLK